MKPRTVAANALAFLLAAFVLANTAFLFVQVWGAESALHQRYQDPADKFIYPKEIQATLGKWTHGKDGWEWRLVPSETVNDEHARAQETTKPERERLTGLITSINQQLNQIYPELEKRYAAKYGTQYSYDHATLQYNFATDAEQNRIAALQAQRERARRALAKIDVSTARFRRSFAFSRDINKQPKSLPGKAVHRLVKNGAAWRWQTVHDDSLSSRVKHWVARNSFGPINPMVSPATVGATRTSIYASLVTYLITSVLILLPGTLVYRRLKQPFSS